MCVHQGGQGGVCGGACRAPGGAGPGLRQRRQQDAGDQCHEAGAGHHDAQREEVSSHSHSTLLLLPCTRLGPFRVLKVQSKLVPFGGGGAVGVLS